MITMSIHLFRRMRKFLRTTLIGGVVALAPLTLIILLFRWIINLIGRFLTPFVDRLIQDPHADPLIKPVLYVITFLAILLIFFVIGLVIRTRMAVFLNRAEDRYLAKIPGYKIAKETVQQFFGKHKSFFREVVLVDIFRTGVLMTGFITDDQDEMITVFVPTGPNPTSGNIYHLPKDQVLRTDAAVDTGMKSIISCGAGSGNIFSAIRENPPLSGD
ncbi:MAG TPA: DUF502 domain-containing protein [Bacteroides sp.]|nr:DUF502 domain-containing protein [Bacteroides sp.]